MLEPKGYGIGFLRPTPCQTELDSCHLKETVAEFRLEQVRPVDLPVPHRDDDLEDSPRPIQVEAARMRSPKQMA